MVFNSLDVFVNCPSDDAYKPIFNSIVYTVTRFGYWVRCALEADDASDNRFSKICGIIAECRFGIHDISRTEADGNPPLPRFNMPLELGLFLGAKRYGAASKKTKFASSSIANGFGSNGSSRTFRGRIFTPTAAIGEV